MVLKSILSTWGHRQPGSLDIIEIRKSAVAIVVQTDCWLLKALTISNKSNLLTWPDTTPPKYLVLSSRGQVDRISTDIIPAKTHSIDIRPRWLLWESQTWTWSPAASWSPRAGPRCQRRGGIRPWWLRRSPGQGCCLFAQLSNHCNCRTITTTKLQLELKCFCFTLVPAPPPHPR